jgi:hypothetical protein
LRCATSCGRLVRGTLAALALTFAVGGCSTHEFHYEGGVPPEPLTAKERVKTAHEVVTTLLRHLAPAGRRVPAAAAAPLAEAALLDAQATDSEASRRTCRRLALSLLKGRIPVGAGLAYPSAGRRTPDALITGEVGRSLLYFDRINAHGPWRSAAARVAQAIINPRLGWTRTPNGYAVRQPGARRRYDIALTAEAGLVLSKLAQVGGGPLAERYGASALSVVRRAQISPGKWHKSRGGTGAMPVAERALTLYAMRGSPDVHDQQVAIAALPDLFDETFNPWGEPRRDSPLVGRRGIGAVLALRALYLYPGTSDSEHVTRWFLTHRRTDGTFEDAAADDITTQAYFALTFAMRGYIYAKGGPP